MPLIVSNSNVSFSPLLALHEKHKLHRVLVRSVSGEDSVIVPSESVRINGGSSVNMKNTDVASYDDDRGRKNAKNVFDELETLWDDGYGTQTIKDYAEISMNLIKSDRGPPRWFCPVACGIPLKDSPVLLYLPGMDGTGAGLVVHEKTLGKVFQVQCLHIPVWDRTPLEGLIQIVEETVMTEHTLSPNKPIYLFGDSFGGTLALAVAACNPTIDLILILANPATSFKRSHLHPLYGLVMALPDHYYGVFPFVMSFCMGDFVKMQMVGMDFTNNLPPILQFIGKLAENAPLFSLVAKVLPNDTLKWRIDLVESAAAYANSRLHAITAQVLVLASGKDNLIPSKTEAQRLSGTLKSCDVCVFEENGHSILLESGVNVLSAIKTAQMYRCFSKHDIFKDISSP